MNLRWFINEILIIQGLISERHDFLLYISEGQQY